MRTPAIALGLSVVFLLGGCSEDPQPRIGSSSTSVVTTASPSDAPSTTAPLEETPDGYIRRWIALETSMQNSGDTAAYRAATAGCPTCRKLADQVEGYYAAGGSVRLPGQRITGLTRVESIPGTYVAEVAVDPEPTTYTTSAGAQPQTLRGDPLVFKVTLIRARGSWTLDDYTQLAT